MDPIRAVARARAQTPTLAPALDPALAPTPVPALGPAPAPTLVLLLGRAQARGPARHKVRKTTRTPPARAPAAKTAHGAREAAAGAIRVASRSPTRSISFLCSSCPRCSTRLGTRRTPATTRSPLPRRSTLMDLAPAAAHRAQAAAAVAPVARAAAAVPGREAVAVGLVLVPAQAVGPALAAETEVALATTPATASRFRRTGAAPGAEAEAVVAALRSAFLLSPGLHRPRSSKELRVLRHLHPRLRRAAHQQLPYDHILCTSDHKLVRTYHHFERRRFLEHGLSIRLSSFQVQLRPVPASNGFRPAHRSVSCAASRHCLLDQAGRLVQLYSASAAGRRGHGGES